MIDERKKPPIVPKDKIPDIQETVEDRNVSLDRVGIENVLFPVRILTKLHTFVDVSAKVNLFAGLCDDAKGHNLSRFAEALIQFREQNQMLSKDSLEKLLLLLSDKLGSDDIYARFEFDYYIDKLSPATKRLAPMAYRCAFTGLLKKDQYDFILEANVIAASVCPCSKEMSSIEYLNNGELDLKGTCDMKEEIKVCGLGSQVGMGAHNQRSHIRAEVITYDNASIWLEDLIPMIEEQASAPVFPLLKRPDEKYVTELGYMNPKFSEDIARDVYLSLVGHMGIQSCSLKVRNEESIHPYDVSSYQQTCGWKY